MLSTAHSHIFGQPIFYFLSHYIATCHSNRVKAVVCYNHTQSPDVKRDEVLKWWMMIFLVSVSCSSHIFLLRDCPAKMEEEFQTWWRSFKHLTHLNHVAIVMLGNDSSLVCNNLINTMTNSCTVSHTKNDVKKQQNKPLCNWRRWVACAIWWPVNNLRHWLRRQSVKFLLESSYLRVGKS